MLKAALKEPLVHFLVVGFLLFAFYDLRGGSPEQDDRRIVITRDRIEQLASAWAKQWQRPPTEEEWTEIGDSIYFIDSVSSASSPSIVDNSLAPWFPPIGDQYGESSCVGWAVGYYVKTFQEAKEHHWDLSEATWEGGHTGAPTQSHQNKIISPDFIYHLINSGVDDGSSYYDAIQTVSSIGACSWEKMPYDPTNHTKWPSEEAWTEAPLYRGSNTRLRHQGFH